MFKDNKFLKDEPIVETWAGVPGNTNPWLKDEEEENDEGDDEEDNN